MNRPPFQSLRSRYVVLPLDNIDTDQIIPARFLKVTVRDGLGQSLFADWRQRPDGSTNTDFPLERADAAGARILVAGENFGCGSSREHAPWALLGWGLRAIVARSFADIFRANALKNGLLPVEVDAGTHERLLAARRADAGAELVVDLPSDTLRLPDGAAVRFHVEPFARDCLLRGVDELGALLARLPEIEAYEASQEAP